MQSDLALALKATPCQEFIDAIRHEIKTFSDEQKRQDRSISVDDQKAITAIEDYLRRDNLSGEILRQDLKTILRHAYGYVGRFYNTLPRRLEALRNNPIYSPAALRRGYAQMRHPDISLLQLQLQKERAEKEALVRDKKQLVDELKATCDDQLIILEENTTFKKRLVAAEEKQQTQNLLVLALQKRQEELQALMRQAGVTIPPTLSEPIVIPRVAAAESWSFSQPLSPALFTSESLSVPSSVSQPLATPTQIFRLE